MLQWRLLFLTMQENKVQYSGYFQKPFFEGGFEAWMKIFFHFSASCHIVKADIFRIGFHLIWAQSWWSQGGYQVQKFSTSYNKLWYRFHMISFLLPFYNNDGSRPRCFLRVSNVQGLLACVRNLSGEFPLSCKKTSRINPDIWSSDAVKYLYFVRTVDELPVYSLERNSTKYSPLSLLNLIGVCFCCTIIY